MKTNKTKKLTINTETLRNLQDAELRQVVGGSGGNTVEPAPSSDGNASSGCTAQAIRR